MDLSQSGILDASSLARSFRFYFMRHCQGRVGAANASCSLPLHAATVHKGHFVLFLYPCFLLTRLLQGSRYFLGQMFCVLCLEICTPSLFSPSSLCGASFKTKQALNLWPNRYLDPCKKRIVLGQDYWDRVLSKICCPLLLRSCIQMNKVCAWECL